MRREAQREREQKLVDLIFNVAMTLNMADGGFASNEDCAAWVRKELRDAGFKVSDAIGMSWGVLEE